MQDNQSQMFHNETINTELIMSSIDTENIDVRIRNPNNRDQITNSNTSSPTRTTNQSSNNNNNNNNVQTEANHNQQTVSSYTLSKLLKMIYGHMDQLGYTYQKENYRVCVNNEWLLIGVILDKILFFVYCSIVIFATMIIFKY